MKIDIQTKIEEYAFIIEKIRNRFGDDANTTVILQEIGKDIRANNIQQNKSYSSNSPATDKQLGYLKQLGVAVSEGLTKSQASKLIEDTKAMRSDIKQAITQPIQIPDPQYN